jgi:excinuclease ABC subunit A
MPANKKIIEVKGAKVHNLKNIDVTIKRNSFVVITGLSGSGKSSLAFDTIYAEGQRRYVESLSSYARQFLGRMNKPEVDFINGLPPAIAIEQKVNTRNPRSTVGTSTEVYDYLKLLFARIGRTFSPITGEEVKKDTVSDVVDFITEQELGIRIVIISPYSDFKKLDASQLLIDLKHLGVGRVVIDSKVFKTKELTEEHVVKAKEFFVVVDRITVQKDEDSISRYSDSIQDAFRLGDGTCIIQIEKEEGFELHSFSNLFERDGLEFEEPSVHMFSFNNPLGACPVCEGYGKVIGIDEDLVIPDKNKSVYDEAVVCWRGDKMQEWKNELVYSSTKFDFPIHKPVFELTKEQYKLLWTGNKHFAGLNRFFEMLDENKYKIQYRVMLSRYRGRTVCPECGGRRLKKEADYVKVNGYSLSDLVDLPVEKLQEVINKFDYTDYEYKVGKRLILEIENTLEYLCDVGLGYLSLNRLSSTLSGGESQRINLATILGSSLVGSLYVLDEPSIGLHPRDTHRLVKVLKKLQSLGNTVVLVEHEEEVIRAAEEIIDIGPGAGRLGGEVVFSGSYDELIAREVGLTGKYLTGKEKIDVPTMRRKWNNHIEIIGAYENNLKGIDVKIPLNIMTVVTGVSGSGKSSLIKGILYPALSKIINGVGAKSGKYSRLSNGIGSITQVEFVDQNPIGKSSRSNPVTYLKAYDEIRKLYSQQQYAKYNGYKPSHFSFNVEGGRCEECLGEGTIKVEMQFMADIVLKCEYCDGRRFKEDILEVKYQGKSIFDVLEMTVNEAIEFFSINASSIEKKIKEKLKPLADVGLGYIKLGQSSSTLSGGESQRVKLASFLSHDKAAETLFIFDEPTTGLHFHDIRKLLEAFNALIEKGHSIVIIEHNQEVIKCADWIIDLGPEGGEDGGYVVFAGTPEDIIKEDKSYTGKFLKEKL